jgi:hypothetical protein
MAKRNKAIRIVEFQASLFREPLEIHTRLEARVM